MNRGRGHSSGGHRADGEIRAQHRVAAGENSRQIGRERPVIGGDAPGGYRESFPLGQRSIHRLPDGRDRGGALDVKSEPSIATGRRRPEASGSPSAIRWQVSNRLSPLRSSRTGATSRSICTPSASACLHFLHQARHLLPAAPIEDPHVPGAQADRGAGAIHGGITAADHCDVVSQRRPASPLATRSRNPIPAQGVLLALAAEPLRPLRSDGHKDCIVPFAQAGEREVLAPPLAHAEPRAEPPDGADLRIERRPSAGGWRGFRSAAYRREAGGRRTACSRGRSAEDSTRRPGPPVPRPLWPRTFRWMARAAARTRDSRSAT